MEFTLTTKEVLKELNISVVTLNKHLKQDNERKQKLLPFVVGKYNARKYNAESVKLYKKKHLRKRKKKQVTVYVFNLNKKLIEQFDNISQCAEHYNVKPSYINELLIKPIKFQNKYLLSRNNPFLTLDEIKENLKKEMMSHFPKGETKERCIKEIEEYTENLINSYTISQLKWE